MTTYLFRQSPTRTIQAAHHIVVLQRGFANKPIPTTTPDHEAIRNLGIIPGGQPTSQSFTGSADRSNQEILSLCKKHQIYFPSVLRPLKLNKNSIEVPNTAKLAVQYSRNHCFHPHVMRYFDKIEHPYGRFIVDIYIKKKEKPLWLAATAGGGSPFPNSKAAKKVVHAMRVALEARGFTRDGRPMANGQESVIKDLYGTVMLNSQNSKAICNLRFADLVKQVEPIASAIVLELRRDQQGRHVLQVMAAQQAPGKRQQQHYQSPSKRPQKSVRA
ncbi:hypothetical protein F4778DRAFT_405938 [Xylariomycetidae sp. FL2044]|nr:hypothetical protein F4778DRAFT_405938 [Xylariomycetidae sp. FL2044]